MKRIVCLLLALVLCMYLPCAAFAVSSPGGSAPTVPGETPKTGDTSMINIWVIVMLLALLALIVAVVMFRKSKKD